MSTTNGDRKSARKRNLSLLQDIIRYFNLFEDWPCCQFSLQTICNNEHIVNKILLTQSTETLQSSCNVLFHDFKRAMHGFLKSLKLYDSFIINVKHFGLVDILFYNKHWCCHACIVLRPVINSSGKGLCFLNTNRIRCSEVQLLQ